MSTEKCRLFHVLLHWTLKRSGLTEQEVGNKEPINNKSITPGGNNSLWNKQYLIPCLIILGNACQVAGSEIRADVGTDVLLPCHSDPGGIETAKVYWQNGPLVAWYTNGVSEIPGYKSSHYRGRTDTFPGEFNRGNLSLSIRRVQENDTGEYQCIVIKESQTADIVDITLTVTEPEVVTETSNVTRPIKIIREPEFVTETSNVTSPNKPEPDPRPFSRTRHGLIAFAALVVIILIVMFISNYCPVPDVRVENAP